MPRLALALSFFALLLAFPAFAADPPAADGPMTLRARQRVETEKGSGKWHIVGHKLQWKPQETAIVICDMWDQHWCQGATRRVADMAPAMNRTVELARKQGMLVIHCPSSCMEAYKDTPQFARAQKAPKVETKVPLQGWCRIDDKHEAALPIDDNDGGCDCSPTCKHGSPWKRQIATLQIGADDAITDSAQAYYLMRERGIKNVIVMGVHVNMCVLGRPFSIRQLTYQGMNVALMRDLTDSMYNSRSSPKVAHHRGTELVVEHIEKYWCPTIESTDFTGLAPFRFADDSRPQISFLINTQEYKTETTIPAFAQDLQDRFGYYTQILHGEPGRGFVGTDGLARANLAVVFARREAIHEKQKGDLEAFLAAGKPLIGLRTASHAFGARGKLPEGFVAWENFDPTVFGGSYKGHGPEGSEIQVVAAAAEHPVLAGIKEAKWTSSGSLYNVLPIDAKATVLLEGTNRGGGKTEPVAWVRPYGKSRIFYTSLGHPDDFAAGPFKEMLMNAVQWQLKK